MRHQGINDGTIQDLLGEGNVAHTHMTEETDQPQAVELSQTSPSAPPAMVTESAAPIADEEAQELPTSSQVRESETSFQEHPEGPHQRPSGAMPGVFVIRHQKACKLILGSFLVVIIGFALHDQSSLLREIEEIGAWPETGWLHFSLSEWHWAAAAGHSAVVEQLLHSAADQETVDRNQEDLPALTSEANGRVVFRKGFAKIRGSCQVSTWLYILQLSRDSRIWWKSCSRLVLTRKQWIQMA